MVKSSETGTTQPRAKLKKFVWDTSAIVNIKEPNEQGYSPGYSLIKDSSDSIIPGPYLNIFPSLRSLGHSF